MFPEFDAPIALVMPSADGVSTKEAYDEFDASGEEPASYAPACEALEREDLDAMAAALYNNLAPSAESLCADVRAVSEWLAAPGRRPGLAGHGLGRLLVCAVRKRQGCRGHRCARSRGSWLARLGNTRGRRRDARELLELLVCKAEEVW